MLIVIRKKWIKALSLYFAQPNLDCVHTVSIWFIKLLLPTKTVGWRVYKTISHFTITTCSSPPPEWQKIERKSMSVHLHTQRRKFRVKIRCLSHDWSRNGTEIVKRETVEEMSNRRRAKKEFIKKGFPKIPYFLCRTLLLWKLFHFKLIFDAFSLIKHFRQSFPFPFSFFN